jgi:hypothetical protein
VTVYIPEVFTEAEAEILVRYFTNLDGPVFALVNLPEVVKGALFARYSRTPKSLRRLFLDEFVNACPSDFEVGAGFVQVKKRAFCWCFLGGFVHLRLLRFL